MLFHTPIFAAFLFAAAIPLILYLIFRSRKRDSSLGSIYILRRLVQSKRKFSEWKRYVIIALRTLALLALPLAFMQPFLPWHAPQAGVFPLSPASTHRVILVDLSQSMAATFGNQSRHDASISLCREILKSTAFPGRVDVIAMDSDPKPVTFEQLPLDPQTIDKTIADLHVSAASADFDKPLRRAAELFRSSPYKTKELYILSDFSSRDLRRYSTLGVSFRLMRSAGVHVFPLSYERAESENFAVMGMTPGFDLLLAGQPTIFYLNLGYYGSKASGETYLTIRNSAGEVFYDQPVTLPPGEKTLEIPMTLSGGEQTLTATLKEDEYPLDNTLSRSFRVKTELNVVVSQSITLAKGFDNPREWLRLALKESSRKAGPLDADHAEHALDNVPAEQREALQKRLESMQDTTHAAKGLSTFVTNANPAQISASLLRDADALIILDTDTVPIEAVNAIFDYATRGGTVILAPGPSAKPAPFNQSFARILPVDLANPVKDRIDPDVYQQCVIERTTDKILRELEDPRHGNIASARFYNWYATVPGTERPDSGTLISLSEGAPLLLEKTIGRGRVLLWTAGFGGDWQSLVVHAAYPVFFTRLLNSAAANVQFPLNLNPGDPIIRQTDAAKIRLITPDGKSQFLAPSNVGQHGFVRYDRTTDPGDYSLYLDPIDDKKVVRYHVAAQYAESDYRPIVDPERKEFQNLIGAKVIGSETDLIQSVGQGYEGASMATWFAIIVLVLLVLEAWLCRRFFA